MTGVLSESKATLKLEIIPPKAQGGTEPACFSHYIPHLRLLPLYPRPITSYPQYESKHTHSKKAGPLYGAS